MNYPNVTGIVSIKYQHPNVEVIFQLDTGEQIKWKEHKSNMLLKSKRIEEVCHSQEPECNDYIAHWEGHCHCKV